MYTKGSLKCLNQLLIPQQFVYEDVHTVEEGFDQIVSMKVRGAPAIAIVAVLSLAVEAHRALQASSHDCGRVNGFGSSVEETKRILCEKLDFLSTSRPTAVNLFIAVDDLKGRIKRYTQSATPRRMIERYVQWAEEIIEQNILENERISRFGADYITALVRDRGNTGKLHLLTHCNTGALATAKYGTALGVVRFLWQDDVLERVFATETRPYNQGARLTAFELVHDGIPVTLVVDSAVSYLFQKRRIDAVVVGADRVCRNGDTANKIGTYQIAISCKHHGIPFFIAAPTTSIDLALKSGADIVIEERPAEEVTHIPQTGQRCVAEGVDVWNVSFDVTPAELITGIITELGVIDQKDERGEFDVGAFVAAQSGANKTVL